MYKAKVVRLAVKPHPNADLHGEIGVFFPMDGQLAEEFCRENNLFRDATLNKDPLAKPGFFEEKRRVRGVKLSRADIRLPRHFDTEALKYNWDKVLPGSLVIITEKLHGTSGRYGYVERIENNKLNWLQKIWNKLPFVPKYSEKLIEYGHFVDTRNTVVNERPDIQPGHEDYYRYEIHEQLSGLLKKGEVLYYEIVGYDSHNNLIVKPHETAKLNDETVVARYGQRMLYTYGCSETGVSAPKRKVYVYRITQQNADGIPVELPWWQVKARASELALETVPEVYSPFLYDGDVDTLQKLVEKLSNGHSTLDSSHIREGICVRIERPDGQIMVFKNKSEIFRYLEGCIKDDPTCIDLEEAV